ncbi:MAG: hypothetical protein ACTHZ7_05340 [Sphingobacterium sp.]
MSVKKIIDNLYLETRKIKWPGARCGYDLLGKKLKNNTYDILLFWRISPVIEKGFPKTRKMADLYEGDFS